MTNKQWDESKQITEKNVQGSDSSILYGNLPSVSWMDWGQPQWPSVKTMQHLQILVRNITTLANLFGVS